MKHTLRIYADGACINNPGPGGWAVLMMWKDISKELTGGEKETTNNRMELTAVIKGLLAIKRDVVFRNDIFVEVFTDSKYVRDGINTWILGWKARKWKSKNKKDIKNQDLWRELDKLKKRYRVEFNWLPGHTGNKEGDRVDFLAREMAKTYARMA